MKFEADEEKYLHWLDTFPKGFVMNTYRRPSTSYAVLHRAKCTSLNRKYSSPGAYTEGGYIKFCAETIEELRTTLRLETGLSNAKFSKLCSKCHPL